MIGGSTKGGWIAIDETRLPDSGTPEGKCKPLGYEWIPGGLTYKFYSFDNPLGECPGFVSLCVSDDYDPPLKADFPVCPAKERFSIGIAGSWNALPRTPKALENHQEFAPIIRKLLDANGLKQAPVRIEYVHSIDLDGDGTEERFGRCQGSCRVSYVALFELLAS